MTLLKVYVAWNPPWSAEAFIDIIASIQHSTEAFSAFDKPAKVEQRMSELKSPSDVKRAPRSMQDTLKYWIAFEFRTFLLWYGIPTLNCILPTHFFQHYILII